MLKDETLPVDVVSDETLTGREWVMRYTLRYFGAVERRPISMLPETDGCYFLDWGSPSKPGRSSAALFVKGQWLRTNKQPFKSKPTHWMRLVDVPAQPSLQTFGVKAGDSGEAA